MTKSAFLDMARRALREAASPSGRIGHLICTQTYLGLPKVREPELRTAFQHEATQFGLVYGIEVPTQHLYSFSGKLPRRALHDFVLYEEKDQAFVPSVLMEFKEGQTSGKLYKGKNDCKISKDLRKLFKEPVAVGRCMMHICPTGDNDTIEALEEKYTAATIRAIKVGDATMVNVMLSGLEDQSPWFVLLLLIGRLRTNTDSSCLFQGVWNGSAWMFERDNLYG